MSQQLSIALKSSLAGYLQAKDRVQIYFKEIFSIISKMRPAQTLILMKQLIINPCSSLEGLKWLMLFNRIIIKETLNFNMIDELLEEIKTEDLNDFDKILTIKLIKPYRLYLMKRCQIDNQDADLFIESRINLTYTLINTIWSSLSFVDILYTFGRYYMGSYTFFIDFNITLGMDLKGIYNKMVRSIPKNQKQQLFHQIQKIHEKMYVVYYNCYFSQYLKPYTPRWILTEDSNDSTLIFSNQIKASNQQFSKPSNEAKLTQSVVFSHQHLGSDEGRMDIIKSMERIISLF